jgi:hypothetical protein
MTWRIFTRLRSQGLRHRGAERHQRPFAAQLAEPHWLAVEQHQRGIRNGARRLYQFAMRVHGFRTPAAVIECRQEHGQRKQRGDQ